jgi:hypothetical protein
VRHFLGNGILRRIERSQRIFDQSLVANVG